ncbi:MAG: diguanylate cyclase [Firmicutes bacterium]|nr:diguanylate cyclase [Bacillota bacterium]
MKSINTYYDDFKSLVEFITKNQDCIFDRNASAVFVQIFSGHCEGEYLSQVSAEVSRLVPHACIIGSTTGGEITNGKVSVLKTVLSFSIFYYSKVRCTLLEKNKDDDYSLGLSLATQLTSPTAKIMLIFATSLSVDVNKLLLGIHKGNPNLPVAGGCAGDICNMKQAIVCCNGKISEAGVVGAVFEGEKLTATRYWNLGWQPIGKTMTITKAEGVRIYTIDHQPAYQVFQKYLGLDPTEKLHNAIEYPLIVSRCGIQVARVPMILHDDNSISFAGDVLDGETVRLSFGNIGLILDETNRFFEKIKQQPVESIFVYSCSSRKSYLQNSAHLEYEHLQAIAPTAGFFTSGEFFHLNDTNQLLNVTMTILALSEDCQELKTANRKKNFSKVQLDKLAEDNLGVLKVLTHLINTVTSELEQANAQLQYNVIGEMAAALGHEVRNPMTTVRGYLQLFQQKELFSIYNKQLSTMIEELDRANSIITEFLSLSKRKLVEMKCGNINNVLNDLFPLLQATALPHGHDIRMATGIIPNIEFDNKEIRQLIINLVRNGLEAMQRSGVLTISTSFNADDNEIILRVQDTGPGISPEIMNQLGTPFITTKDKGTGLGLSICYRIADRHGAKITITTGTTGTTFNVKFKACQ